MIWVMARPGVPRAEPSSAAASLRLRLLLAAEDRLERGRHLQGLVLVQPPHNGTTRHEHPVSDGDLRLQDR